MIFSYNYRMKQLNFLYSGPEELKAFMQANALNGPILVQLFACDKFDARRISHEVQSMNKDAKISVLISSSFECSKIHFTILPSEANVVAQVQPLEFDFFHSSPVAVFNYVLRGDDHWIIIEATQSVSQWGYLREYFVEDEQAIQKTIYKDDLVRVRKTLLQSIENGRNTINQRFRINKEDGSVAWVSDYTQILRNPAGEAIELICYWVDISQDKENEVLYTEIINATTEGFWLLDANQKIIDVNHALCDMLGVEKEEIVGKKPFEFISEENRSVCQKQKELLLDTSSHVYEIDLTTRSGKTFNVIASSTSIYDQLGNIKSFTFITDISKQKQLEEYLIKQKESIRKLNNALEARIALEVQKNREKDQMMYQQSRLASMGEMIGNIAHQWRQPLNIMALIMQDLYISDQLGKLDSQKVEESYEKANNTLQFMSQTIDDFRYFFEQKSQEDAFSIKEAVDSVCALLDSTFVYNHVLCKLDIQRDSIVSGSINEFKQVFINILNNAQEAILSSSENRKEIEIEISQENRYAVISISDAGGGIAEEAIGKIFDPYFTTKEKTQGTGLGLYMSKQIIENLMLGSLSVRNTNEGAEFTITLPLKKID
jgi:PAS domain S-box-containing protein